ncbi:MULTISPECIES: hypothetical protein [Mesobacillus]|uniref:Uncharacterized protein n=2 Tax=Mesobacillus TaxID=2675231 RepID=A0A0D6ZEF0_9BACI|nr:MULTISPECIES: hypothetical protein [Mesobacillus]KIY23446.1 hypothetical protein UB32_03025 [Mesobacillus subterraneus]MDQ0413745.1 hypothetical protein [Mesobacillus stamsii]
MKKILIVGISVLTLTFGGLFVAKNFNGSEPKVISDHAKVVSFETLSEMENESPIIVRGKKLGKLGQKKVKSKVNDNIISGWTEAEFLVKEVIKTDGNEKVKPNAKISVGELVYEHEGIIHTTNGYKEMKNGEDYLLFLIERDGVLSIRGVTFGKVPLNTDDVEMYADEDEPEEEVKAERANFAKLFNEAKEKYGK